MTAAHQPEPAGSRALPVGPGGPALTPATPHARALVAALALGDPMRAPFDSAVRAFVRAERRAEHTLDDVLATLRALLRDHVEPPLPAETRTALREAAAWFAVSEFYRAD
jgi:hypothetical protein